MAQPFIPFIYVATLGIKEGKLEEVTRTFQEIADTVMEHEPQVIAFHGFVNDDGTEMTVIQVHPDTASMDFHMQVLREKLSEHVAKALGPELFEIKRAEYYGTPSQPSMEMDRGIPGLDIVIKPRHIAGFSRTATG
jgi:quinol monooxygenase YgiN